MILSAFSRKSPTAWEGTDPMDPNQGKIFAVKKKVVFFAKLQRNSKLTIIEQKILNMNNGYNIDGYSQYKENSNEKSI